MAKTRQRIAGRILTIIMVMALLFAASGTVFVSASAAGSYGTTIYLKTTDTTQPYIHYWVDGNSANSSSWPGVAMTKVSGETDVYSYDLPCDVGELTGVIFNNGSGGNKMTGDIKNITGNLYTLSGGNGTWSMFDTSSIKITSFGSDLKSPQYTGSSINLSIKAEGGDGNLQYKISVDGAKSEVLSDYSSRNSVVWTPTVAGDYTVLFEVKDGSGETNSRQIDYTVKDSANAEEPVFLSASPANNSQIQKGGSTTVSVNGAGGKLNTNLLFYKTEVLDPDGEKVNTVYYQLGNRVTFTANKLGTYTVNMYIQNSSAKNTTIMQTYTYTSVNEPVNTDSDISTDIPVRVSGVTLNKKSADLKVGESTTLTATVTPSNAADKSVKWSSSDEKVATVANGTVKAVGVGTATITVTTNDGGYKAECTVKVTKDPVTDSDVQSDTDTATDSDTETDTATDSDVDGVLGDVDGDGKVRLKDASVVQQVAAQMVELTAAQKARADVNHDGKVSMKDASVIQQAAAKLVTLE